MDHLRVYEPEGHIESVTTYYEIGPGLTLAWERNRGGADRYWINDVEITSGLLSVRAELITADLGRTMSGAPLIINDGWQFVLELRGRETRVEVKERLPEEPPT